MLRLRIKGVTRFVLAGLLSLSGATVAYGQDTVAYGQDTGENLFGFEQRALGTSHIFLSRERYATIDGSDDGLDGEAARHWNVMVELLSNQPLMNKLTLTQKYFSFVPYIEDTKLYGVTDHWARVGDTLRVGGDCEDHAIAKYRMLADAGVPVELMKIILVEDTITGEAHAFLKVNVGAKAMLLDNRYDDVISVEYATTYRPLYALNENTVWAFRDNGTGAGAQSVVAAAK